MKGSDAINPPRWENGRSQREPPWLMDSGIPWRRVILMSPHQATDSGTGPDDWVSVRPTIFVAPLFDSCSGYGSKGDRMQGICRRTWSVRETYAERTQDERTQHRLARFLDVLDGLFLAGFLEISAVSSRISSFSQILGLSESRRQSPGWHSLDGNLPILFLALPLRVRHVRNSLVPPPRQGSPSCWTTWFTLRAPLLFGGFWGGCPGAHRVSSTLL